MLKMLKDYIIYAFKNITHRKLRSWLTVLGIVIGIAAVVGLISLGQGLQTAINSQFESLGTDKITIQAKSSGFGPPGTSAVVPLTEHDLNLISKIPGVKLAASRMIRQVYVGFDDRQKLLYAGSMPKDKETWDLVADAMNLKTEKGRLIEPGEEGKVVLGNEFSNDVLFGKPVKVGDTIKIQETEFEVVGILQPLGGFEGSNLVVMDEDELNEVLGIDDEIDLIVAQIDELSDIETVSERIEKEMRKDRDQDVGEENFDVSTPQQILETANTILFVVQAIVIGIAAISLVVGGIGILNTMYTAVLERTNEIGVMKAVGAKNSDILWIFLLESGLIGLVGGLIGLGIGAGLSKGIEIVSAQVFGSALIQANLPWWLLLGALAFSLIVGIASGLTPAIQASKMKPVDSLRYE